MKIKCPHCKATRIILRAIMEYYPRDIFILSKTIDTHYECLICHRGFKVTKLEDLPWKPLTEGRHPQEINIEEEK